MAGRKQTRSGRRVRLVPIVAVLAVLAVLVGLVAWVVTHASGGTPRLAIDTTAIDLGHVPFDTFVDPTFTITNAGNAPLKIADKPEVEIVQGC